MFLSEYGVPLLQDVNAVAVYGEHTIVSQKQT
jgi:hypothetical protein